MIHIRNVLSNEQVKHFLSQLGSADWSDGRDTAGYLSRRVKDNEQLPENSPLARKLGSEILDALDRNSQFLSAALPQKIVPPLFNRYGVGQTYGNHIDGAIRPLSGTPMRIRTDLSATLFLSSPSDYDGGELITGEQLDERRVKLVAGDMVLYPGSSVHRVTPITRGTRVAAFFWIQSMVRETEQRSLLHELDSVVQALGGAQGRNSEAVRLAGIYHNLLRRWADS